MAKEKMAKKEKKKKRDDGERKMMKKKKEQTEEKEKDNNEETAVKSIADLFSSSSTDPTLAALFDPNAEPSKPRKRIPAKEVAVPEDIIPEDTSGAAEFMEETIEAAPVEVPNKKRKRKDKEQDKIDDIENRYLKKVYSKVLQNEPDPESSNEPKEPSTESTEGEEIDPDLLQHEALTSNSTAADKTIFISNLPVKVLTSKPHLREIRQIFSTHGHIESIRFRSIAFSELGPRKVAFITKKLHPERDTLNAYIVYKNADSVTKAVEALNGYVWADKHLRVDSVANPTPHDNRRCVFVGNLPFDVQDEQLYTHFKRCGEIEFVRVVRDKKTNIGKGFGYVQFKDRESVDKAVLLNDKPVAGLGKRRLRVTYARKQQEKDAKIKNNVAAARVRLKKKEKKLGDKELKNVVEGLRASKTKSGGSGFKMEKKRGKMRLVETKS